MARAAALTHRIHELRAQIWRLRLRRRRYLTNGMPVHAHRLQERIIALGWRLRRAQAAAQALTRTPSAASAVAAGPPPVAPVKPKPPAPNGGVHGQGPSVARAAALTHRIHELRAQIWRLRLRRRRYLTNGMPVHAHRLQERIIALGWRLRRAQAAAQALTH